MVAADLLRQRGLAPFHFTDFTPFGCAVVVLGVGFIAIVASYLATSRCWTGSVVVAICFSLYRLHERLFSVVVPKGSQLHGRTLAESKLGSTLGVQVLAIDRHAKRKIFPSASDVLFEGDTLLCGGKIRDLEELHQFRGIQAEAIKDEDLAGRSGEISGAKS
jgi:di/tricarboxylate transporter